jgi:hypothetical protein
MWNVQIIEEFVLRDSLKPRILFRLSNFCLRSCMSVSFTCTVVLLTYIPAVCMWRLGLKCDNCNFCGEKTKVYTESDTDTKKGQKYSTVNLGIHVGLQSSPLGVEGLRALYIGVHFDHVPCKICWTLIFHNVRFCSLQCHSYFLAGAPVQSPVALVSDERNAYCQYFLLLVFWWHKTFK